MKRFIITAGVLLVIFCAYYLFEPIMIYNLGWEHLTKIEEEKRQTAVANNTFQEAIEKSVGLLFKAHKLSLAPAISVAAGYNGHVVWAEARGFSDLKQKREADPETTFRIGSVSKAVTSVALGKMLENQALGLDDTVSRILPYYNQPDITVRQLASHMSGIRNYGTCFCFPIWEYYNNDSYSTIEKSVAVFKDDPLLFEPGSAFSYSSYNYTLLSGVLEQVSGKPFLQIMNEDVFQPLQLKRTFPDFADSLIKNKGLFYEVKDNQYKEAYPVDNSNKWASGGFLSTPTDLVKLGNALLTDALLKPATIDTLFSPQRLSDGPINEQNYGLGWRHDYFELFEGELKVEAIHHGGTALGSTALLVLFPKYDLSMAIIMNKSAQSFPMFDYLLPMAEQFILQIKEDHETTLSSAE